MLMVIATFLQLSLTTSTASNSNIHFPGIQSTDSPLAPTNQDLRFDHLTSEDGLSNNRVLSVIRDSQGFMWFGTLDGLNRYDGYEFKIFRHDPADEYSLSANLVMALYQDRDDFLWVGTSGGGLNRYDPANEQFNHYRHDPADPNTLSSDNVSALYQDREGMLWIGTDGGGLNRYDPTTKTFTRYANNPDDPYSLSHNVVWAMHEDKGGVLWMDLMKWGRIAENRKKIPGYPKGSAEAEYESEDTPPVEFSISDELEKLAGLRDQGAITDEEFEAKKKQLLDL